MFDCLTVSVETWFAVFADELDANEVRPPANERYSFDVASRLTSKTVDSLTTSYTYDAIGQLLSESRTGYAASYTYDANGNRATRTLNGVTETYSNDSGDKLTAVTWTGGSKTFGYDGAGRTTSIVTGSGTTSLTYDYESRVTGITYPGSARNSFSYNGLDTRVGKTDSAGASTFRRMGAGVTAPVLGDGSASYTPGVSERRGSTSLFYGADYLGTNARLLDASQATDTTRTYDAFGNLDTSSGSAANPFGFAGNWGYQKDSDSDLMLLGHRCYDASTGRFLTRDPIKDGRNWYGYCGNSPPNYVDPEGLLVWFAVAGVALGLYGLFTLGQELVLGVAAGRKNRKAMDDAFAEGNLSSYEDGMNVVAVQVQNVAQMVADEIRSTYVFPGVLLDIPTRSAKPSDVMATWATPSSTSWAEYFNVYHAPPRNVFVVGPD